MKIIFFIILILCSGEAFSQVNEEWVRRHNGSANSYDIVSKMIADRSGNVYVFGSSNGTGSLLDFVIIKYNSSGAEKWVSRYNGEGSSSDQIISACVDDSGNCYVTGYSTDLNSISKLTTAKFDSSGNVEWVKIYDNQLISTSYGQDIAIDASGNLAVCGPVRNISMGRYSIVLLIYDSNGNTLATSIYDGDDTGDKIPVSIKFDSNSNIIIGGSYHSISGNTDMLILKYDLTGNYKWAKRFNGTANSDDRVTSMVLDNENNIYFCGSIYSAAGYLDYFYSKLDTLGTAQWSGIFNGAGNDLDIPYSIEIDLQKNLYITGFSRNDSVIGSEDVLAMKISPAGSLIWNRVYSGAADGTDQGNSVAIDKNGNVYVGGAMDMGNVHLIYALLKYDASGNLIWIKNYAGSNSPEDFIYDVDVDSMNNVYVTGISLDSISDYDIVTIKYSQTVDIKQNSNFIPANYFLSQNYPNPFNPFTNLEFGISFSPQTGEPGTVSLKIYDMLGKEVATLVNAKLNPGTHKYIFDASGLASGIYYYTLSAGHFTETKRMTLIK